MYDVVEIVWFYDQINLNHQFEIGRLRSVTAGNPIPGLPAGLLPEEIKSYTFSENGHLEVFLESPCLTKYENRVYFEQVITANLTYGSLIGVEGLQQEELFLWLPIKDIIVDDPSSGLILFDIGLAYKQLSFSLFDVPPHCKPQDVLKNHVKNEKGFVALW
ncbi:hypothetical protein QL285_019749 [Trifolium repens]|nr:hypothetical protein QL285_019749 [Trifolium repens]